MAEKTLAISSTNGGPVADGGRVEPGDYDKFFEQQKAERTWGEIVFRFKDGEVIQVRMLASYRTIKDALRRRSSPMEDPTAQ